MGSVDLKLVLIGQKAVGKTCIFNRYVYDTFPDSQMTVGAYFAVKQARVKEDVYKVAVWDTAGEEKFDSLTSYYCRGAQAAVVCFDLTDYSSFKSLDHWISKVRNEADDNCFITILGNKLDIVEKTPSTRKVDSQTAQHFADGIGANYKEVSAFSGTGVNEAFANLVATVVQNSANLKNPSGILQMRDTRSPSSKCC